MDYNWNHTSGNTVRWETKEHGKEKEASQKQKPAADQEESCDQNTDRSVGMKKRTAQITRKTKETDIRLSLDLDGSGQTEDRKSVV